MIAIHPQPWSLPGAGGLPILGDTRVGADAPHSAVLVGHGFKGYRDYGFLPRLGDHLAAAGCVAAGFNFSHGGMTERDGPFTRPDLFALDTWNKQVADWHALLSAVRNGHLPGVPTGLPVFLFGHSRGGLSALLAAARLPAGGRPAGVVTAGAPADADRGSDADAEAMRAGHAIDSPSGRTGQTLRVMPSWLLEQDADREGHDPVRAAATLGKAGVPLRVIHGTGDGTIPPADADRLAAAAGVEPVWIREASHVFDAPNPMPVGSGVPAATAELFDRVASFVRR